MVSLLDECESDVELDERKTRIFVYAVKNNIRTIYDVSEEYRETVESEIGGTP